VDSERLGHGFVDAHAGIERGEGVLKHHLHLAALGAQRFAGEAQSFASFEQNLPLRQARSSEEGFVRPWFFRNSERDTVHRLHPAGRGRQFHRQLAQLQ